MTDPSAAGKFVILNPPTDSQRWAEPLIARLATETWRLGRRLDRFKGDQHRALLDSYDRLRDALTEYGVETVEHEGQAYDAGLGVEVLHQEHATDGDPVIAETIRPTILLNGRLLLQGQVVIEGAR